MEYELSAKLVERNVLSAELDEDELEDSAEYQRLEAEIADLRADDDGVEDGTGDTDWEWVGADSGAQ